MDLRDTYEENLHKLFYCNQKYFYCMYSYFPPNGILPVKQIAHFSLAEEPGPLL